MPDDGLPDIAAISVVYDRQSGRFEYDLGDLDDFAAHAILEVVNADIWDRLPVPHRQGDPPDPDDEEE